jgi:hypothetical protein
VPRYNLIASADIVETASETSIKGRVSEISRKGCYIDVLNTLPVGSLVDVLISRDQGNFATKGKIIYALERMGMGVAFLDPPDNQLQILDSWLAELSGNPDEKRLLPTEPH